MIASALVPPDDPELPPVFGGGGGRRWCNAASMVSTLSSLPAVPPHPTSASKDAPTRPPINHFHPDPLMCSLPFSLRAFRFVPREKRTRGRRRYQRVH